MAAKLRNPQIQNMRTMLLAHVIANGAALFWWGLSFVSILLVAFLYAWRKGALKWE